MQDNHRGFIRLKNFGALNGPDGYGKAVNHCGETMEIFLRVRGGRVQDALFFSDGCLHTLQAGVAVTGLAQGKSVRDCLAISEELIWENAAGLPADHGQGIEGLRRPFESGDTAEKEYDREDFMRIAISSTGPAIDDLVDPRFGRCRYYLFIESDTMQIRAVDNTSSHAP